MQSAEHGINISILKKNKSIKETTEEILVTDRGKHCLKNVDTLPGSFSRRSIERRVSTKIAGEIDKKDRHTSSVCLAKEDKEAEAKVAALPETQIEVDLPVYYRDTKTATTVLERRKFHTGSVNPTIVRQWPDDQ